METQRVQIGGKKIKLNKLNTMRTTIPSSDKKKKIENKMKNEKSLRSQDQQKNKKKIINLLIFQFRFNERKNIEN
jgi:hypothetical protein